MFWILQPQRGVGPALFLHWIGVEAVPTVHIHECVPETLRKGVSWPEKYDRDGKM